MSWPEDNTASAPVAAAPPGARGEASPRNRRRRRGSRGRRSRSPQDEVAAAESAPEEGTKAGAEPRKERSSSFEEALHSLRHVADTLRVALKDIEQALRLLDEVEKHKAASDHQIESLQKSLRALHGGRERTRSHLGPHAREHSAAA